MPPPSKAIADGSGTPTISSPVPVRYKDVLVPHTGTAPDARGLFDAVDIERVDAVRSVVVQVGVPPRPELSIQGSTRVPGTDN